jgi:hypothetical protein
MPWELGRTSDLLIFDMMPSPCLVPAKDRANLHGRQEVDDTLI